MEKNRERARAEAEEIIEIYCRLPWYDRLYFRMLIAWKTKRCPIIISRPAMRLAVAYIVTMLILSRVIATLDQYMDLVVQAGASLSIALIVNQIVSIYGHIRRLASHPRRSSGD